MRKNLPVFLVFIFSFFLSFVLSASNQTNNKAYANYALLPQPNAEPTANPTNLIFTNIRSWTFNVSYTAASGAPNGYLVLRSSLALPNTPPTDGTAYSVGDAIGNAKVAYVGAATTFQQKSVVASTTYYYAIYAYNGSLTSTDYRQTSPLTGSQTSSATDMYNYYCGVSPSSPTFINDLKTRIRNPYTRLLYSQYDENIMANVALRDTSNGQKVATCVYSGFEEVYTPPFAWTPISHFSREHSWPQSWMPYYPSTTVDEYSDYHALFPTDQNRANSIRSNYPYGKVVTPTYTFLGGKRGLDADGDLVYEPRDEQKGDAARALFYMAMRYDGINGNAWTFDWLNNTKLPALGVDPIELALMLQWHAQDPPDKFEIARNDYIQTIQQNRNPFIDHPEWVSCINFANLTANACSAPIAVVTPSANICATATSISTTLNLNSLITAGDLTGTWAIVGANGGTTLNGSILSASTATPTTNVVLRYSPPCTTQTFDVTIMVNNCSPLISTSITDPCTCNNNATTLTVASNGTANDLNGIGTGNSNGTFSEEVTVTYDADNVTPGTQYDANIQWNVINIAPNVAGGTAPTFSGTSLLPVGTTGTYTTGVFNHTSGTGYTITVRAVYINDPDGVGPLLAGSTVLGTTDQTIQATCSYPEITFSSIPTTLTACSGSTLDLTTITNPDADVTYTNPNVSGTIFNAANAGAGSYNIAITLDPSDAPLGTSQTGDCTQPYSITINVATCPSNCNANAGIWVN